MRVLQKYQTNEGPEKTIDFQVAKKKHVSRGVITVVILRLILKHIKKEKNKSVPSKELC